jgi:hypothetical protein
MDSSSEDLYRDLEEAGGLRAVMSAAVALRGGDIRPVSAGAGGVALETERGVVQVRLGVGQRLFLVNVHTKGSTDDLALLVEAVAAWRDGMPLDDYVARFAFMELDTFARALENGDPTPAQWSDLLACDFHARQRDLLRRMHADETLRTFFPTVTHGAVRLRVDAMDGVSRQILVYEPEPERYEVLEVGTPDAAWAEVPAGDLIACVREFLTA